MVEWKKLGEVANLVRGKVISKDYIRDYKGEYPVYSSQTANDGILGNINSYMFDGDFLTWTTDGAYAGTIFRRKGRFNITNVCGLIDITDCRIDQGFLYFWLSKTAKDYVIEGMGNPKLMSNVASSIKIPIPFLSEQERIVGILDTFTSSIENLKQQIAERRKQYEHYRDQLLDLEGKPGVEMKKLGEIVVFRNGKGHEKIIIPDGKYIVVNSKFISSDGSVKKYCNEQISPLYVDDILMVMSDVPNGKAIAKCYLVERNNLYTLNQRIGAFHVCDSNVITKYLFYVINRNEQLLQYDNKTDQTNLKKDDILNITIPLPPLQKQHRIVSILDTFEASIHNLEAQLKEREKQYEYYRNKLLTFE